MKENKKNPFCTVMEIIAGIVIIIAFIVAFKVIIFLEGDEGVIKLVLSLVGIIAFGIFYWIVIWQPRMNEYHKPLMNYEGNNKSYDDIEKLLNLVYEHNCTRPGVSYRRMQPIYLPAISSKEELKKDKKYTVEIKQYDSGYVSRIFIREQNDIQ